MFKNRPWMLKDHKAKVIAIGEYNNRIVDIYDHGPGSYTISWNNTVKTINETDVKVLFIMELSK